MKNEKKFKPSTYLRKRHPDRYSDSIKSNQPQLTTDLLEYHLETLTSRSQEKEFEYFSRRLAEKTICPNLIPQTGPTGGGDSKVDSETFPVADSISIRWYQGDAGGKEQWAFAMSAKKVWRPKVKSDVKKIVDTKRGYSLIYFFTNQFVSDKKRAEVEDALTKEFKTKVKIRDRSWIIDQIIHHDHINIAIETLSIEGLKFNPIKIIGSRDSKRISELEILDSQIKDTDRYSGISYQLSEDCLRGAILASYLEKDRYEVDGRFTASLRVAEEIGDERQILRIIYKQAWIAYFSYDDEKTFFSLYDKVEKNVLESPYSDDAMKLCNMFSVLVGYILHEKISPEKVKLEERSKKLLKKLHILSDEKVRPNNAASAKTLLYFKNLTMLMFNRASQSEIDKILYDLKEIFERSQNLGQYPFDTYKQMVIELGFVFIDSNAYDELCDSLTVLVGKRSNDGESGILISHRGLQKLQAKKIYDAIILFGKAQQKLIKDEYKDELIKSLAACGSAYKQAGLFWAARSNFLAVLSITLYEFNTTGYMHPLGLISAQELAMVEISLGRVPHILFSIKVVSVISSNLKFSDSEQKTYSDFIQYFDICLSVLILKFNLEQLNTAKKLPYVLKEMGLICSEGCMLFALGNIKKLKQNIWLDDSMSDEKIENFYKSLMSKYDSDHISKYLEIGASEKVVLRSNVIGCNLIFEVENHSISILITETMLGALESFLATSLSLDKKVFPYAKEMKIIVKKSNIIDSKLGIDIKTGENNTRIEINHKENFDPDCPDQMSDLKESSIQFIAQMLPRMAVINNIESYFKQLMDNENVFGRSLLFSDAFTVSQNVFGDLDWTNLSKWFDSVQENKFSVERKKQWMATEELEKKDETLKFGDSSLSKEEFNDDKLSHQNRKILSVIDIPKWNLAKWGGVAFIYPYKRPPYLALLFKNEQAARDIFTSWRNEIGSEDSNEEIRVCILKGVDKTNPLHYRVHIGSNLGAFQPSSNDKQLLLVSRFQIMEPKDTKNIDTFLSFYNQYKAYYLIPAILPKEKSQPKVLNELSILKKELYIRHAWDVGMNDPDMAAILPDDQPIIPSDVTNAPILETLSKITNK